MHLSFYTDTCTDRARLAKVALILLGRSVSTPPGGRDLDAKQTEALIVQALQAVMKGGNVGPFTAKKYPILVRDQNNGVLDRIVRLEKK
jgi:hypothetical protein